MSTENNVDFLFSVLSSAKTDSQKLAALLVVGKFLPKIQLNEENKSKLLTLIGYDFLLKLLNDYYDSIGSDLECDKQFSIDIIVYFFPILIEKCADLEIFIELIAKILQKKFDSNVDQELINNLLLCFEYFNFFLKENSNFNIDRFVNIYFDHIVPCFLSTKLNVENIINVITTFSNNLKQENFNIFCDKLSQLFVSNLTSEKFSLCLLIKSIIQNRNVDSTDISTTNWIRLLRDGLFDIFKHRLNDEIRKNAFDLASELTLLFNGLKWIQFVEWNNDNVKFFLLLFRLVCIEINIAFLDDDSKNLRFLSYNVHSCLIILEHCIVEFIQNLDDLADNSFKSHVINSEIMTTIETITETVSNIIKFIKSESISKTFETNNDVLRLLIASIRLLCLYIIEESETLREEIIEILPFILQLYNRDDLSEFQLIKPQIIAAAKTLYEDDQMKPFLSDLFI